MLEGKTSHGEGVLAGVLTVPKSVRFIQRVKQRRIITALCCNVSLLSWQVTPHVGSSERRTQPPRHSAWYYTQSQIPRSMAPSVSGHPSYRVSASSCALAAVFSCPDVKRLPRSHHVVGSPRPSSVSVKLGCA